MTSETPRSLFVWVWLPGAIDPVVAGRVHVRGELVEFNYGRSYLGRADAIPLYTPELPLEPGRHRPRGGLRIAGCLNDASPDAWGQRVILHRLLGGGPGSDTAELAPLTYLLESGSDRIGGLDFQLSSESYVPRRTAATLDELVAAADRFEAGEPFSRELDMALLHGSSVGGARPKALLADGSRQLIAKFSSRHDPYPVVKAEAVAMALAKHVGLDVAATELTECLGHDVLLVERFDRPEPDGARTMVVSALTILELDEMMGRYATYVHLADAMRARFTSPTDTLRELFARIVFNVLVGNTDDHARNHAAFWNGRELTLTPAYDICPQPRAGGEAAQAMAFGRDGFRMSQLAGCIRAAEVYLLTRAEAREIIDHQRDAMAVHWTEAADLARLTTTERTQLWGRQVMNPYGLEDY